MRYPPSFIEEIKARLAKIQKEILASTEDGASYAFGPHSGDGCDDEHKIARLSNHEPQELFAELKDKKVVLPMDLFFRLIMGSSFSEVEPYMDDAKESMPGAFDRDREELEDDGAYEPGSRNHDLSLMNDVDDLVPGNSIRPVHARIRIIHASIHPRSHVRPEGHRKKSAAAGGLLAKEYAKYLVSFATGLDDEDLRLTAARSVV